MLYYKQTDDDGKQIAIVQSNSRIADYKHYKKISKEEYVEELALIQANAEGNTEE